jgi:hypothetical protein
VLQSARNSGEYWAHAATCSKRRSGMWAFRDLAASFDLRSTAGSRFGPGGECARAKREDV